MRRVGRLLRVLIWCSLAAQLAGQSAGSRQAPKPAPRPDVAPAIMTAIDGKFQAYDALQKQIWGLAEVGYQEEKSSALLQAELTAAGFSIQKGVADVPTAFVATYGSGRPVISILAEYDALPGLSQQAVPEKKPVVEGGPGHGCGHHLFGVASVAAAIAVKDWLAASGKPGTVRLHGTPAEEGGGGKVYQVRAGLFKDVDVVIHWHPGDENVARAGTSLANISGKFRFHGVSSHAAADPERGRSALDAVEAMNFMVNLMREHVPQETRMHYVITRGGVAPNVVPDFAEVYHYARHPDVQTLQTIWERLVNTAKAAALGTDTKMDYEVVNGVVNVLANEYLAKLMHGSLERVGGVKYSPEERAFAETIRKTFPADPAGTAPPLGSEERTQPFRPGVAPGAGSTDVGDVSWVVPTVGLSTACFVPGTPGHSWQAVAAGGTTIGTKGLMVAAKTMALTAVELMTGPEHIEKARAEWKERAGEFAYKPLIGDRKPPLDYRKE